MEAEFVRYTVDNGIAVIVIDRPQAANAQNPQMLQELDAAWDLSDRDPEVRVVVLRSEGKHFSAGHDMQGGGDPSLGPQRVDGALTVDTYFDWEERGYLHYAKRWRDLVKPSIAAVQGKCIAAGLMLCWPCDLIIAAENAQFSDPVVRMGIGGVEYHGHTWELGPRKAKEILFTGRAVTADEAEKVGMVNRVVPLDELDAATMELAKQISEMHPFALRQAKRAVNQTLDVQGFYAAIQSVFDIHETGHGNALSVSGYPVLTRLEEMKGHIRGQ